MIQTMDATMSQVTDMMQRMRELGIQSLNGTYTAAQRSDMNEEFKALGTEMGRIASATKFNGIPVFKTSSMSVRGIQVGWETGAQNKIASGELKLTTSLAQMSGSLLKFSLGGTGAASAITRLDKYLSESQTSRAKWGAIMNRLDYTITNLQTVAANTKASRSAIQDTDYAAEAANLARYQVLQQAGQAMLSQSNQNSQQVLSLLK
jgi:flagellin